MLTCALIVAVCCGLGPVARAAAGGEISRSAEMLDHQIPMLPELLWDAGYVTAAIDNLHSFNHFPNWFNRGYEYYINTIGHSGYGVARVTAEAIVAGRQGGDDGSGLLGPYRNVQEVRRLPEVNPVLIPALQQFCDVRSRTFEVKVDAEIAGYKRQFTAILGRNSPKDIQVLTFSWEE